MIQRVREPRRAVSKSTVDRREIAIAQIAAARE